MIKQVKVLQSKATMPLLEAVLGGSTALVREYVGKNLGL